MALSKSAVFLRLLPILLAQDISPPVGFAQVPTHRVRKACSQIPRREIAQFPAGFREIYGVAAVMPRTIAHVCDQLLGTSSDENWRVGKVIPELRKTNQLFIQQLTEGAHDMDIRDFAIPTNVVHLTRFAFAEGERNRQTMIAHMQPVANLQTVSIYRQRLSLENIDNRQRD